MKHVIIISLVVNVLLSSCDVSREYPIEKEVYYVNDLGYTIRNSVSGYEIWLGASRHTIELLANKDFVMHYHEGTNITGQYSSELNRLTLSGGEHFSAAFGGEMTSFTNYQEDIERAEYKSIEIIDYTSSDTCVIIVDNEDLELKKDIQSLINPQFKGVGLGQRSFWKIIVKMGNKLTIERELLSIPNLEYLTKKQQSCS